MYSKENDTTLSFINQILMEEEDDMENNPIYMLHHSMALQATERSLYEAINNPHQQSSSNANPFDHDHDQDHFLDPHHSSEQMFKEIRYEVLPFTQKSKTKPSGCKEQDTTKDSVDLRSLLMQCAVAIADNDSKKVSRLMLKIRRQSSPRGTAAERVAHYFANALEARIAGTALPVPINMKRSSGADVLKVHKMIITMVPFTTMTHLLSNGSIMTKVEQEGAATLHIIDFGIRFGFQWPSLILALSEIPGGPPKLRITGIDYPDQPGIAEALMDTGARLSECCGRLRVPFKYNGIAQKFETIKLEDLMIEKGEMVVVNSAYRLQNVTDMEDAVNMNVPRDDVLNLIRRIDPYMFVHSVINMHNTPFFVERFREAFIHFSSMFDMYEAAAPLEEEQSARESFEGYVMGRSIMSIVGCEGTNRVERPESYKQWQLRTVRAGFRQIDLDEDIVKRVRVLREDYHNGFSVGVDGMWTLLEWKGRAIHAVSCWKPLKFSMVVDSIY